ncbi:MAG: DUF262 domain-containing protein [Pseudomonadota bacterium]
MKLQASDPDVETIVKRIKNKQIDLQPDFQRGSVWNAKKKQLLIDSILRKWHIPPVHIVSQDNGECDEVLDGQQRLAAIYDFCLDEFPVDGKLEPHDDFIASLDGLKFSELPNDASKIINNFSIRVISVTDFDPKEPGELFYRLNHQVTLTPAEARNAYFGKVRDQVREIAKNFERWGLTKETIGFSNARMAHDDVVARIMCVLDWGSIKEKVTASKLADRYRSGPPFPDEVVDVASNAFENLGGAIASSNGSIRLNKATLWSWVLFVAVYNRLGGIKDYSLLGDYLTWFEESRVSMKGLGLDSSFDPLSVISVFNDRAASRVADVSSVVIRDLILWGLVYYSPISRLLNDGPPELCGHIMEAKKSLEWYWESVTSEISELEFESEIVEKAIANSWGDIS